jgi:hypothetical protein
LSVRSQDAEKRSRPSAEAATPDTASACSIQSRRWWRRTATWLDGTGNRRRRSETVGSAAVRRSRAGMRVEARHSRSRPSWCPVTAPPPWRCAAHLTDPASGADDESEVDVASSVDRSCSATAAGRATTRPPCAASTAAMAAADAGGKDTGSSVVTCANDTASPVFVVAVDSEGSDGRDVDDDDASDTAAAAAEDDVETVDEGDDTAVASLLLLLVFPLLSPAALPLAMQSFERSCIWRNMSATGYHFVRAILRHGN